MVSLRKPALAAVSALLRTGGKARGYITGRIARDEELIFFPTLAREQNATHWEVPIHGWVFEPERSDKKRQAFLSLLRRALHVSSENKILKRRVRPFLVDNERWKSPVIRVGDLIYRPPLSGKNGHFKGMFYLHKDAAQELAPNGLLPIKTQARDGRIFQGVSHLVPEIGLSVISDIDDTIKVSNVTNKKSLLQHTFLLDFEEVPGMSQVYTHWKSQANATFHFVSSSPYQLYEELEAFRIQAGFPAATFHLKTVRPKDKSVLNLFADPYVSKTKSISSILNRFPSRKFILVGDSGERDPEVYANIYRLFQDQILAIYIRKVSKTEDVLKRAKTAFEGLPVSTWAFFDNSDELATVVLPPPSSTGYDMMSPPPSTPM